MSSLQGQWQAFKTAYDKGGDVAALQKQLVDLKIALTQHGFLQSAKEEDRIVARNVLEHAALVSVKAADTATFERNVAQLQGYYATADSPLKYEILGLNLVRLLASNKIAEFHTELELIPVAKRADAFIQYPVAMEQYMMEGSFHKVLVSGDKAPSPSYGLFVKMLGETVRTQIAECISHAYHSLSPKEAAELLMIQDPKALEQYESQFDWKRGDNGSYVFAKPPAELRVPKRQVMAQTLVLAEELERII